MRICITGGYGMVGHCIQNIADNYPEDPSLVQKESMRSFIMALSDLIPCHSCGLCFRKYLDMPTIDLCEAVSSRENCIKFFVDAHNYVNKRLDKSEMNVEEATTLHESSYVNTNGKNTSAKCS